MEKCGQNFWNFDHPQSSAQLEFTGIHRGYSVSIKIFVPTTYISFPSRLRRLTNSKADDNLTLCWELNCSTCNCMEQQPHTSDQNKMFHVFYSVHSVDVPKDFPSPLPRIVSFYESLPQHGHYQKKISVVSRSLSNWKCIYTTQKLKHCSASRDSIIPFYTRATTSHCWPSEDEDLNDN
jgi:hypothetical protein